MNTMGKASAAILFVVLCAVAVLLVIRKISSPEIVPSLSLRWNEVKPSSEVLNAQRAVDFYREQIHLHPGVVKNYVELAQLLLQEARITGRHHEYLPKARYLLDEALDRDPQSFEALITKASFLMTLHQFGEAKQLAAKALAINSYSAFAYGVLVDAHVELGEYKEAVTASDRMLSIRPDLRSYARASYLRELHGDVRGAEEAMKLAADAGVSGQENRAWALYNLGLLFLNEGKLDTAGYIFRGILEERPMYVYAMSGLAQVRKAKRSYAEAIELLVKAAQVAPEHLFLEQLADIYQALDQKASERTMINRVLEAFAQHEKEGWNIDLECALFCTNHNVNLFDALKRAEREYARRPQNIDALQTYAWTLFKNGRASEAAPYIERAMKLNTKRALLHRQAAAIFKALGNSQKSEFYSDLAAKENPLIQAVSQGSLQLGHSPPLTVAFKR